MGEKALEFELRSDTTERVELSAFRQSKLLLLFVSLAFTTCEVKNYVLCGTPSMSIKRSTAPSSAFAKHTHSCPRLGPKTRGFALPSDYNRKASSAYRCPSDGLEGPKSVGRRAAHVIGHEGAIRYSYICFRCTRCSRFREDQAVPQRNQMTTRFRNLARARYLLGSVRKNSI